MLILVAVTVSVAMNGGLFDITKKAATQTQKEASKENLQAAVISAYNEETGKIDREKLKNNLGDNWKIEGEDGGPYLVSLKDTTENEFTITQTGKIGYGWVDNGDETYTKGIETKKIGDTYTNEEVQSKLGATGGTYDGTWTVIGVEGEKLKLVSTEAISSGVVFGYEDPKAKEAIKVADENNLTYDEELSRAVWSYNHAVETLNELAKTETGIKTAESLDLKDIEELLGITDADKGSNFGKQYRYYYKDGEENIYSQYKSEGNWIGEEKTGYTTFRSYDKSVTREDEVELTNNYYDYRLTDEQKNKYNFFIPSIYESFWLATACIEANSTYADLGLFTFANSRNLG